MIMLDKVRACSQGSQCNDFKRIEKGDVGRPLQIFRGRRKTP